MNEEILAATEECQAAIGQALADLIDKTGVNVESIELVDATTAPPTVKVTVALATADAATTDAAATDGKPQSIDQFFGQ